MKGRNVNQVCDLLTEMTGTLTFVIAVGDSQIINRLAPTHILQQQQQQQQQVQQQPTPHSSQFYLRALFDYDPEDDLYIPCRELGICFNKGTFIFFNNF